MPTSVVNSDVDRLRDELLDVVPHLLQHAERLAAALVLEHLVRQRERMPDAVRVDLAPSRCVMTLMK